MLHLEYYPVPIPTCQLLAVDKVVYFTVQEVPYYFSAVTLCDEGGLGLACPPKPKAAVFTVTKSSHALISYLYDIAPPLAQVLLVSQPAFSKTF